MFDRALPPLVSDASVVAILDFLKLGGVPAAVFVWGSICAWTGNWPWRKK